MKIIVGIGNPGKRYADTRHNIGFTVVDRLAGRLGISGWRRRFHAQAAEGTYRGERVLLLKPETYVNESGRAVAAAVHWRRVALHDVMVVCDDFNLDLGRLRVRGNGSSGGHKGLASIAAHVASDEVPRLRIGIGAAGPNEAREYVLSFFSAAERQIVEEVVAHAVRALEVWMESGLAECQNKYNAYRKEAKQNDNEEVGD